MQNHRLGGKMRVHEQNPSTLPLSHQSSCHGVRDAMNHIKKAMSIARANKKYYGTIDGSSYLIFM